MLSMSTDVEDRSNAHKGCNAIYVEDVKDGKRTYRHIFIITFLIWYHVNANGIYVKDVEDGERYITDT